MRREVTPGDSSAATSVAGERLSRTAIASEIVCRLLIWSFLPWLSWRGRHTDADLLRMPGGGPQCWSRVKVSWFRHRTVQFDFPDARDVDLRLGDPEAQLRCLHGLKRTAPIGILVSIHCRAGNVLPLCAIVPLEHEVGNRGRYRAVEISRDDSRGADGDRLLPGEFYRRAARPRCSANDCRCRSRRPCRREVALRNDFRPTDWEQRQRRRVPDSDRLAPSKQAWS